MAVTRIERSIEIRIPVSQAYLHWTRFEEFPRFMHGVDAVHQLDERRLRWRAHVGPRKMEWESEIVARRPDELVAWRSITGSANENAVYLTPLQADLTRVRLDLLYAPDGFFAFAGDAPGAVARRMEGDLERFRNLVEVSPASAEVRHVEGTSQATPGPWARNGKAKGDAKGGGRGGTVPPGPSSLLERFVRPAMPSAASDGLSIRGCVDGFPVPAPA